MTWLGSLRERRSTAENPTYPLTSQALVDLFVGPKTAAGVTVTEQKAIGLPAVFRAVALISDAIAGLPLHAYRDISGGGRARLGKQPDIITKPHPDMTQFEWLELVMVHLLGWGNAYLWKQKDAFGRVVELWPIHPSEVKPGRASDKTKVYQWKGDGYSDAEILHIPGLGYDGVVGLSPIRAAATSIGTALAAEENAASFYGSGSMLSGILSTDQKIDTDTADRLKARWKQSNSGLAHAHDIAVLGSGATFEPISVNPVDAQLVESQRWSVAQVARIFGVPPHLLMDTEKSTSWGTGIEQQSIGFVTYTLRPWLIRLEQRLTPLLPPSNRYVKFSVEGLLRGDTKSRYDAYAIARQWGWMSPNDILALEDRPPIKGGDTYMTPLNMAPLGAEPEPAEPAIDEETPDA